MLFTFVSFTNQLAYFSDFNAFFANLMLRLRLLAMFLSGMLARNDTEACYMFLEHSWRDSVPPTHSGGYHNAYHNKNVHGAG